MSNLIIRLTWTQTNDYFDIAAENPDFASWYVDNLQSSGNLYNYTGAQPAIDDLISELKTNINSINPYLHRFKFPVLPFFDNMYDQHNLNILHKTWISIVRKEPRIDQILYKISPKLHKQFHDINLLIHNIEHRFIYRLRNSQKRVENKFKQIIPASGIYNVSINYSDWGKSSWDKFVNGVDTPNDFELSNWETIGSEITINLCKPYKFDFPPEYLTYCSEHNITPTVLRWPLGNLVDYKNKMPGARKLMNKNVQIANNNLTFSIIK